MANVMLRITFNTLQHKCDVNKRTFIYKHHHNEILLLTYIQSRRHDSNLVTATHSDEVMLKSTGDARDAVEGRQLIAVASGDRPP